ncbi:GNAT family N-acetyltransferase [Variovorax sp. J22P271]|uniref:GNAT family N-acetyltransferase n=1 Tax=Variovorax davisae TaxID=3053515 RepID=UPI0025751131|nr:GNAT family N-acetyltransferase [Variovorax sp. J22P271]MDM0034835.1 GNAT family N-acetyltransferase [Variovorax sp. J22P271]
MSTPQSADHPNSATIAPADAGDVEVIRNLTRSAYGRWVPLIGREPLPMKVDYAVALQSHRFDLLIDREQVVGLIETVRQDQHLLIVNVAIEPACQGRGFGRRLIAHAESLASASGLESVRLYTNIHFAENIRLYASLGYEVEREEALNGGVAVHMTKKLDQRR